MTSSLLPDRTNTTICFAHAAYRLGERFALRRSGIDFFEVRTADELWVRIDGADVLVVSGLWRNELIGRATRLRFVQSISAGIDQYSVSAFGASGIRLASAQGANERAVAEHAVALILALSRKLHTARDHQLRHYWRPMISDPALREDELGGKTLLVVGLGRIGSRLATLGRAFGMRIIGIKRNPAAAGELADAVVGQDGLIGLLPQADVVALTCPLTPQTERLINAEALAAMKPSALLVNVARGRVVDESALIAALASGRLAGAGLDCSWEEPLPPSSPLWALENVLITPHSAGETRRYEDNVIDLLLANLERLWAGETRLVNQVL